MGPDELRNIIRRVRVFSTLGDDECDALMLNMRTRALESGHVLFREGTPGDTLALVVEGMLVVRVARPDGTDAEVGQVHRGQVVGEMACIDAAPRSASVIAAGKTVIYELSRDGLRKLARSAPSVVAEIVGAIIRDVTARLRDVVETLVDRLE